jgi:2-amino-4-hydroxy-6-hydroxymethyldihydropteridine diphosphokinase
LKKVYLSLGANMGDRLNYLKRALEELESSGVHIQRVSRIYETEPQGYRNQSRFLNMVAEVETNLFPNQLLRVIHTIERRLKRRRKSANGPRTIDIDIILYGNSTIKTPTLEIPHPRYKERLFVLTPLSELVRRLIVVRGLRSRTTCVLTGLALHPPREYSQSKSNSSPSHAKSPP